MVLPWITEGTWIKNVFLQQKKVAIEVGLEKIARTAMLLSSPAFTSFSGAIGSALGVTQQKEDS